MLLNLFLLVFPFVFLKPSIFCHLVSLGFSKSFKHVQPQDKNNLKSIYSWGIVWKEFREKNTHICRTILVKTVMTKDRNNYNEDMTSNNCVRGWVIQANSKTLIPQTQNCSLILTTLKHPCPHYNIWYSTPRENLFATVWSHTVHWPEIEHLHWIYSFIHRKEMWFAVSNQKDCFRSRVHPSNL